MMVKNKKKKFIKDVWRGIPLQDYDFEFYYARIDEVLKTIDERERCAVEKIISGKSCRSTGKMIANLGYGRKMSEGVCGQRVSDLYRKATRKLRHPSRREVWAGNLTGEEWWKNRF